jgi:spore coat polysaccharide biosynthesis protein SpsF (cytidylyltransferase family)
MICQIASSLAVPFYRGPTKNKLLRWKECCHHFKISKFHTVDADDPFFCGLEIERSFSILNLGYDMVEPSPASSSGGATVGFSITAEAVTRACELVSASTDTEMMWSFVKSIPNYHGAILDNPKLHNVIARMTLDYWEDYIFLEALRLLVGNYASREDICNLLNSNPDIVKINSFRTQEWSLLQKSKSTNIS